jgi:hypothetical protein
MMRGTPAGEAGTPGAIGHAADYLASDEAAFVHGSAVDVYGGRTNIAVMANLAPVGQEIYPTVVAQNWRYCAAFARRKSPLDQQRIAGDMRVIEDHQSARGSSIWARPMPLPQSRCRAL